MTEIRQGGDVDTAAPLAAGYGLLALPTGNYFAPPHASTTNGTRVNGTIYLTPLFVLAPVTIAALICETTVAGAAGSLTRLGLWLPRSAADRRPGALLLDGGTVATDAAPGVFEKAIANTVLPAGVVWVGAAPQGAVAVPTYRITSSTWPYGISDSSAANATIGSEAAYSVTGFAGAFGDLSAAALSATGAAIVVGIKGA